jgi:hypothetical protein
MTPTWMAVAITVGIVLTVDLLTTYLRKRARRPFLAAERPATETESEDRTDEGVALEHG